MSTNTVASDFESLPAELRERRQWLLADLDDKRPVSVNDVESTFHASATNREEWLPFDAACHYAKLYGMRIGYVLSADDPYSCIDFDVKPETHPDAMEWFWDLARCWDSYTELSAGGKGLHLWVRGKIGAGRRRFPIEVYSQERFIICTGKPVIQSPIRDRQEWLTYFVDRYLPMGTVGAPVPDEPQTRTDMEVINRIMQSEQSHKFIQLLYGKWQQYNFPSQSEADAALLGLLFNYTRNSTQLKRIFRTTELGTRDKAIKDNRYLDFTIQSIRKRRAIDTAAHRLVLAAADGVIQEQYIANQKQSAARDAMARTVATITC